MAAGPTTEAAPVESPRRAQPYAVVLGLPIGTPQILAGLLLLAFAGQALWLAWRLPLHVLEVSQIRQGLLLLEQHQMQADSRSLLVPVLAAIPLFAAGYDVPAADPASRLPQLLARLPFLAAGLLLGASLWYVARRLYGNAGGYIALAFYAFLPPLIVRSASVQPTIIGAWGGFGAVFTAIAVAHTLYAPREVILWNWKRILLVGLSFALAIGAQPALLALAPVALAFMLYIVPERRKEAIIIFLAGCAVAALLLWAIYGFSVNAMAESLADLAVGPFPGMLPHRVIWSLLARFYLRIPAVLLLLSASLAVYAWWRKPRFFGVTAPLLVWALLMLLGVILPYVGGFELFVAALPFALVFIAGVSSDLLETQYGGPAAGVIGGILAAHAAFSIAGLLTIR